jgi:hypothetical protein
MLRNRGRCVLVGEGKCEGGEGVFAPFHPKLAVNWSSFGDSKKFFRDSRQLL